MYVRKYVHIHREKKQEKRMDVHILEGKNCKKQTQYKWKKNMDVHRHRTYRGEKQTINMAI